MILFHVGALPVYGYGLVIAAAGLAALPLLQWTGKREGASRRAVSWFALLAPLLAVLCARIGYCLASLEWFLDRGVSFFFQFSKGGFLFYGALAGGLLAAILTRHITGQPAAPLLDAAAAPAALVLAAGRLAESMAGLGYGQNIEDWFSPYAEKSMIVWENPDILYRFPFGAQDYYGEWNFAIFLPEALTALVILAVLLIMKRRRPGGKAALLVLIYAAFQTIWESMRQDAVLRWGFVRCNQLFSAIAVAIVLGLCFLRLPRDRRRWGRIAGRFGLLLLCCGVMMAMEFALEQKIDFLTWMRMDVCYLVMFLGSLGLLLTVLPLWKEAYGPLRD